MNSIKVLGQFLVSVLFIGLFAYYTNPHSIFIQAFSALLILGMFAMQDVLMASKLIYSNDLNYKWSVHRWVSSSFMHVGNLHLLANLISLQFIYSIYSKKMTDLKFVGISVFLVLISFSLRAILEKRLTNRSMISVGASNLICGWIGFIAIQWPELMVGVLFIIPMSIGAASISLLCSSLIFGIALEKCFIDHLGHAFGVSAGFILGALIS